VINLCHLGEQISDCLGDGSRLGVRIRYSLEQSALETGGGIRNALDLLTDDPFLVVNGDIWCDLDFASLPPLPAERQAHLLLVANPSHNPSGDFHLDANGAVANQGVHTCTFAGIGIYRRALFLEESNQAFPLAPLLRRAADRGEVSGQLHRGAWSDIGTPQRLADLQSQLAAVG
jgi:MurNAc alpha-1-phosphate uridylyltransferase